MYKNEEIYTSFIYFPRHWILWIPFMYVRVNYIDFQLNTNTSVQGSRRNRYLLLWKIIGSRAVNKTIHKTWPQLLIFSFSNRLIKISFLRLCSFKTKYRIHNCVPLRQDCPEETKSNFFKYFVSCNSCTYVVVIRTVKNKIIISLTLK